MLQNLRPAQLSAPMDQRPATQSTERSETRADAPKARESDPVQKDTFGLSKDGTDMSSDEGIDQILPDAVQIDAARIPLHGAMVRMPDAIGLHLSLSQTGSPEVADQEMAAVQFGRTFGAKDNAKAGAGSAPVLAAAAPSQAQTHVQPAGQLPPNPIAALPAVTAQTGQQASASLDPTALVDPRIVTIPIRPDADKGPSLAAPITSASPATTALKTDSARSFIAGSPPDRDMADLSTSPSRPAPPEQTAVLAASQGQTKTAAGFTTLPAGTGDQAQVDIAASDTDGVQDSIRSETRLTEMLRTDPGRSDAPRPELARQAGQVSQQLVDSIRHQRDGSIEISLSPEELGRVRLSLQGNENTLHVSIQSERSDTQELMRRHIALLQSDFEKLGYSQISFDFGNGSQGQSGQQVPDASATESVGASSPTPDTAPQTLALASTALSTASGLDLRL